MDLVMFVIQDRRTQLFLNVRSARATGPEWLTTTAWSPTFTDTGAAAAYAAAAGVTDPYDVVPLTDGVGGYHRTIF